MSGTPSTRRRRRSPDAASDRAQSGLKPQPFDVAAAAAVPIARGSLGFVWANAELICESKCGSLVDFVTLGAPLAESVLAFYGLEDQIAALRTRPEETVVVPNIAIVRSDGPTPRMDLELTWQPRHNRYLLTVSLVRSTSALEVELARQTRTRQIMEAQLIESAAAIERANRDLADFAYIISHDLKAPMRGLRYHVDELEVALGKDINTAVKSRMEDVRAQTRRMSQMLSDLLAYSRVGRKEETLEAVDTGRMVKDIVASLPKPKSVRVLVGGRWPKIETSPAMLDLVLRNIIDNALKHGVAGAGEVRIDCVREKTRIKITVKDQGPGIAPEYHEAVFRPFLRLRQDGEGSGIGLAIVRRAAETMGARLTLQSDPALRPGTTVVIDWPAKPAGLRRSVHP